MNCEWAEEHLSEFLDNALDSQSHSEVQAHLASCSHCQTILDDYRRYDRLLSTMPRVEPSNSLRSRIFDSPEYRDFLAQIEHDSGMGDAPTYATYAADSSLPDAPFRISSDASGETTPIARSGSHQRRSSLPPWARVALPAAAAVVIALGGGYATFQRLGNSGQTSSHGTSTIGDPGQTGRPFAAGNRVVYERDGVLWSAPERGAYPAQALTPSGIRVAGWAVSPLTGASNARYVAYIDAQTGAIHIIRGDGQSDTIVAHSVSGTLPSNFWQSAQGQTIATGLSWSPDGSYLAYLATDDGTSVGLRVAKRDGTSDHLVAQAGVTSAAVWSPDGRWIAFMSETNNGQNHWVSAANIVAAGATSGPATGGNDAFMAAADSADASATGSQVAWYSTGERMLLTWAARDGDHLTGLFALDTTTGSTQALSPKGTRLSAAAFNARTGQWLAANGTALSTISLSGAGWSSAGTATAAVKFIAWAPAASGGDTYAAIEGGGQIALWSTGKGLLPLAHAASDAVAPVWSPDGTRVAYLSGDNVILLKPYNGGMGATVVSVDAPGAQALQWAPDGQTLAIADASGVLVVNNNGSSPHLVDVHTVDGGALAWSVAK